MMCTAIQVAETRLALRTHRPNVEACDDAPQGQLVVEVGELQDSIAQLTAKLGEAEEARLQLVRAQTELRRDLSVKAV